MSFTKTQKTGEVYLKLLFLSVFITLSHGLFAETLTLPSDQEIILEEYGKPTSKNHLIWMHSERGISAELQKTLLSITQKEDIHILQPDWLDSYFISPSRSALEQIPQQDFEDLLAVMLKRYKSSGNNKLFISANGRMASLLLNAAHHLQTLGEQNFDGLILISPYLQKQTPKAGMDVEYQEITAYSNLPLYVFQAERSPRFVPLPKVIAELQKGGSPVYTHILKNIRGGFHSRDVSDLTPVDLQQKKAFPKQVARALTLLSSSSAAPLKPIDKYKQSIRKRKPSQLQVVELETPTLLLSDLHNNSQNITDYKGKIVLVSFWASWCKPCIEEMPSLVKLKQKYQDKLEILAVNVREDKKTIAAFTRAMQINFPILQDLNSKTTNDWKVFVYPSNYVVDMKGKLRFAATGAMDWQDKEIEALLESLMKKP